MARQEEAAVGKGRVDDAEERKNGGGVEPVVYDECGGGGPDHGRNDEAVTEEEESVVGLDGDAAQVGCPLPDISEVGGRLSTPGMGF
ncbi:MAG: hypothetical protein GQ522_00715 [Deltaproteobacteria bacterium]|nr:hypothetical protein [Deltaproteobacteria bacterium]